MEETFPMMMEYEVRALERLLLSHPKGIPLRFLEWGSGRSTIYFTRFLRERHIPYLWVSIEHNPDWYEFVKKEVGADPSLIYRHAFKEDRDTYVGLPRQIAKDGGFERFDIALVDGIHRNECLKEAASIADTVLLHDAQRKSYDATGTFLAGRLLKVGPDDPLSRIEVLRFRIHEMLWKAKGLILGNRTP